MISAPLAGATFANSQCRTAIFAAFSGHYRPNKAVVQALRLSRQYK